MTEFVKIPVEIFTGSEVYKKAVELANINKDISIFNTPEKFLSSCKQYDIIDYISKNYDIIDYISKNMDILAGQADAYRKKNNDI